MATAELNKHERRSLFERRMCDMKKYEAPVLTEMTVGTEDVMVLSGGEILGGKDPYKADINWDLL